MKWPGMLGILGALAIAQASAPSAPAKKLVKAPGKSAKSGNVGSGLKGRKSKLVRTSRKASGPSYQLHPDPERYAEIQRALAERGYFHGDATGEWKDDSVDALKRFQADQKLPDDGKISALTLSGLGLGPRHDGSTAATVPLPTAVPSDVSVSGSTVGPASSPPKKDPPPGAMPQPLLP